MNGLTDALRERLSRRGRTAQVRCGALGVLTVEALSPKDCAALLKKDSRALLYAACRELQQAGEELRREGKVFAPDEIMQFVSDSEAGTAAQVVLQLSGAEAAEPEKESMRDRRKETGVSKEVKIPAEPKAENLERRLEIVQDSRKKFSEFRRDFVQKPGTKLEDEEKFRLDTVQDSRKKPREIRRETVQAASSKAQTALAEIRTPDKIGRASCEFPAGPETETQIQNLREISRWALQDVAGKSTNGKIFCILETPEKDGVAYTAHESKLEMPESLHEMKSDFLEAKQVEAHESKSEIPENLHEMKSDFPETAQAEAHESKSEMSENLHEMKSDFPETAQAEAHESKSEMPESLHDIESDFAESAGSEIDAERLVRHLLEGLLRAARAR